MGEDRHYPPGIAGEFLSAERLGPPETPPDRVWCRMGFRLPVGVKTAGEGLLSHDKIESACSCVVFAAYPWEAYLSSTELCIYFLALFYLINTFSQSVI